ncbi:MAG: GcrA family cell cycle regulator [Proteobacteria bacterium]|nr:GcrA family cell cycle regulator [Pseudomonadota bacterium]
MSSLQFYSPEEIDLIGKLLVGGLSASQIAAHVSIERGSEVTRSMIVGKVHRDATLKAIGFTHGSGGRPGIVREVPGKQPSRPKDASKRPPHRTPIVPVKPAKPVAEKPRPTIYSAVQYDADTRRIPLEDLERGDCRWPVNDPAKGETFLFCGQSAETDNPYCTHHRLRSLGFGTEGERRAEAILRKAAA